MTMIIIRGHECERGAVLGGVNGRREKGENTVKKIKVCYIDLFEVSMMKPIKHCSKKGSGREGVNGT
jgi:hypothetical protein